MPSDMSKDDIINYKKTIRSWLFNHKKFVESFYINSFIKNETNLPCHGENSPFIWPEYGHILTGNHELYITIKLEN